MKFASDMRIPVLFGAPEAEVDDAYLTEGNAEPVPSGYAESFTLPAAQFGHVIGCTCCTPRGPAADALSRLFRARATGSAPFFKRVIVRASPAGEAAIRAAIAGDILTAARYRPPD
jgi:hypothetical protein